MCKGLVVWCSIWKIGRKGLCAEAYFKKRIHRITISVTNGVVTKSIFNMNVQYAPKSLNIISI